jgi:hypothetical protein
MRSNLLQLNASKTVGIWFATARHQHQLPTNPVHGSNEFVMPASSVRNMGILPGLGSFYEQNHLAKVTTAFLVICDEYVASATVSRSRSMKLSGWRSF